MLEWFEEIDSTNAHALRVAKSCARQPLWVVAAVQHQGRGRRGRTWIGEPGNLFASLLLSWQETSPNLSDLSFVAAVACADMLDGLVRQYDSAAKTGLKWPNDVLINGEKVGGILLETSGSGGPGKPLSVAIGIGLNVAHHPSQKLNYPTTDFATHGISIEASLVFEQLAKTLDKYLSLWQGGSRFDLIKQCWLDFGPAIGQALTIDTGRDVVSGGFAGLDEHGGLQIRLSDGSLQTMLAGDVIMAPELTGI